jgi:hypothetical protein
MSPRDLAFIGCRLLALYFVYIALMSIPQGLFALSSIFGAGGPRGVDQFYELSYEASLWRVLAHPILSLAMVLVLWFGAGWLSREVADGAPDATASWSPRSLLSVGVVLLGLVLVSFALPKIVLYLLYLADGAADARTFQTSYLASEVVQALIGFGLILGSERIAAMIADLRRW